MALKRVFMPRLDLFSETVDGEKSRRAWRFLRGRLCVSMAGAAASADLGGSSNYSIRGLLKTEVEQGSVGTAKGHG
jgi:hypothetical protein